MKNRITPWLQSYGILIPLMGSGLIFFLRSLIPAFSNPSVFTLIFQLLSLGLIFSNANFKSLYKSNFVLFSFYLLFLIYIVIFFIFLNKEPASRITDILYLAISIVYIILIHKLDYSISKYLLKSILILSFIINLCLIYTVFTNPSFVFGMRATVNFNTQSSDYSGNPSVYSKNAVISLIVSLIYLFKEYNKSIFFYIFNWLCFFAGLAVLFLTIVRTSILVSPLIIILLALTFIKKKDHLTEGNIKFKNQLISFSILFSSLYLIKFDKIDRLIETYGNMASLFVLKALNTILGQNNTEVGIDPSAMYRINTINYVKDLFINNPLYFIFGNGYKFYYVDVPVLEVFLDFGIIGLILYLFYISFTYYFSFKNIFLSNDNFQIFVSIYIITGFLSLFTQGRPIDYTFFMHAAFYIRFLKIT